MELVDVNTQDFQYLTLSQYNGEKKYVRARCELLKDEPFISDTSNAFVAVESFRLSCAPNEGGIVYRMLPNTYAIQCERDTPADPNYDENVDLKNTLLTSFFIDSQVYQDEKLMNFVPDKSKFDATVYINDIVEHMAKRYSVRGCLR